MENTKILEEIMKSNKAIVNTLSLFTSLMENHQFVENIDTVKNYLQNIKDINLHIDELLTIEKLK